jgi:site-specific recombinase XerD
MKIYADHQCMDDKPTLKKAVVWSLCKFGEYLALLQVVNKDPAQNLRHPKFHPRAELPEFLSQKELRRLLEYSALHLEYRDFAIVSLMASSGLRLDEVAHLKRRDARLREHWLDVSVKGGWFKKTPLSSSMAVILKDYLMTRNDQCNALFVNGKARPASVTWLQRMVKTIGEQAGLPYSLTCNYLRHTFATHAADQHGKVIAKALMGMKRRGIPVKCGDLLYER